MQSLEYLKNLDVDITQATYHFYTIYLDDKVTAKQANKKEISKHSKFGTRGWTLEEEKNKKELTPDEEEKNREQMEGLSENIRKVIEWAATGEPAYQGEKEVESVGEDDNQTLTPIQKHTLSMTNIALPLAQKIWSYDKKTNLLMRKQVAELI